MHTSNDRFIRLKEIQKLNIKFGQNEFGEERSAAIKVVTERRQHIEAKLWDRTMKPNCVAELWDWTQ